MTVINSIVLDQAIRSISIWISNFTISVKPGVYPVLLTGGVEVSIEVRQTPAGFELVCKIDDHIVNREQISVRQSVTQIPFFSIYEKLSKSITETIYENGLINDLSLTKLMCGINNRNNKTTHLDLPGGFTVDIDSKDIVIKNSKGEEIEMLNFNLKDTSLSPSSCIPKTIAAYMQSGDFKPFII